jgi:hypothetical protein
MSRNRGWVGRRKSAECCWTASSGFGIFRLLEMIYVVEVYMLPSIRTHMHTHYPGMRVYHVPISVWRSAQYKHL